MNDIDELIERLQEWAENEPDLTGYGGKVLKEAITALERLWRENEEYARRDILLSDDNTELQQRIDELEEQIETDTKICARNAELYNENKRLDAALGEIEALNSMDYWPGMRLAEAIDIARKARASERE